MDRILELLKDNNYTLNEMASKLNLSINETEKIMNDLVEQLEVYVTRKNKYGLFKNSKYQKGKVFLLENGSGYVILDNFEQVYVSQKDLHCAKNNDIVAIEIINNNNDEKKGKVVKIKKKNERYIGEIVLKNDCVYIMPDDILDFQTIYSGDSSKLLGGLKVVFEIGKQLSKYTYDCNIVEILGHKDDPEVKMKSVLRRHNVEVDFPEEVNKEIENISLELKKEDIEKCLIYGEDLRDERTVTIDGEDTKDFDDAITIKKIGEYYNLKVSIANVSYYVKPDTNLFNNATKRGTSYYIPGANVPMLPRELSNGICSLNPGVDRLALTFDMLIDKDGNLIDSSIYDSIINSKKRMTYKEVNKILEDNIMIDGYQEYLEDLLLMKELHLILRNKKISNGFIDFDINENKVILDEKGKVKNVILNNRGISEKIIEDFMIQTGEMASIYLDEENIKHVYRVHGYPNDEKLGRIKKLLENLKCNSDRLNNPTSKNLQLLLESLKGRKDYLVLARELLKCMQKAIYTIDNNGHYALCTDSICQVTSPIRRAGDLINHVLIRDNIYHTGKGSLSNKKLAYLSSIASSTERNATNCEIECKNIKICEYMAKHIGEEYLGIITHVDKYGLYVELSNQIEGFIDIRSLGEKLKYNEEKFSLIDPYGKKYMLGSEIKITVVGIDYSNKKVCFEEVKKVSKKVKTKKLYS